MKVQWVNLSFISEIVNNVLQLEYDYKVNGVDIFTKESVKSLWDFVNEFNNMSAKFKIEVDNVKKSTENVAQDVSNFEKSKWEEITKIKDKLVKDWQELPESNDKEKRKKEKTAKEIAEKFTQLETDWEQSVNAYKADKIKELNELKNKIEVAEFELPDVTLEFTEWMSIEDVPLKV